MKGKKSLRIKVILIFVIASLLMTSGIIFTSKVNYTKAIRKNYEDNAMDVVNLAASIVDGDDVEQLKALLEEVQYQPDETYKEKAEELAEEEAEEEAKSSLVLWWERIKSLFSKEETEDEYDIGAALDTDYTENLQDLAQDYIKEYKSSIDYESLRAKLNNIMNQTDTYYLYIYIPTEYPFGLVFFDGGLTQSDIEAEEEDDPQVAISTQEATAREIGQFVYLDYTTFSLAYDTMEEAEEGTKSVSDEDRLQITTTWQGGQKLKLGSCYQAILDSNGDAVAFVGADILVSNMDQAVFDASRRMIEVAFGVVVLTMALLILWTQRNIIHPIQVLKIHAQDMTEGVFVEPIPIKGSDEISEISDVFNRMADSIQNQVEEVRQLNEAYFKYVPSDIFRLLDKESVLDVGLGDQKDCYLSVLNMGLSNFNYLLKDLKERDKVTMTNRILEQIIPFVLKDKGIIENFEEDGFVAFYEQSPAHALDAAISIAQQVNKYNEETESIFILKVAMGLSYGSIKLGVVGHEKRLEILSMSRDIQTSKYLKSVADKYASTILLTESAVKQIRRFKSSYHQRYLGQIYHQSIDVYEGVYDVFDGDEKEMHGLKRVTKSSFEKGVSLYEAHKFYEARTEFVKVLKINRRDKAARNYLSLCNQYYQMDIEASRSETLNIAIERI